MVMLVLIVADDLTREGEHIGGPSKELANDAHKVEAVDARHGNVSIGESLLVPKRPKPMT